MSAAKRRTLWLTDEAWAALNHIAKTEGTNPSRVVASYATYWTMNSEPVRFGSPRPAPKRK